MNYIFLCLVFLELMSGPVLLNLRVINHMWLFKFKV